MLRHEDFLLPSFSVRLRGPLLKSETGWTGELWPNRVLLILRIAFFSPAKKQIFLWDFSDFFLRIGLHWKALVESCISNIEKRRGFLIFFFWSKKIFFKNFGFLKIYFFYFLRFSDFWTILNFFWIFGVLYRIFEFFWIYAFFCLLFFLDFLDFFWIFWIFFICFDIFRFF